MQQVGGMPTSIDPDKLWFVENKKRALFTLKFTHFFVRLPLSRCIKITFDESWDSSFQLTKSNILLNKAEDLLVAMRIQW
ncbi:hypothetical protein DNHGIG_21640 [Collibacillus ludicampi]|uniref:Uncharacterized protein n=1 Tax=Collibacillus ludicampi TaxID=2771369 RepID=A0AAV4LFL2_9BACL|nr:hypothetical protein DNHGIG_21640 [Collibacillus ludicampi]